MSSSRKTVAMSGRNKRETENSRVNINVVQLEGLVSKQGRVCVSFRAKSTLGVVKNRFACRGGPCLTRDNLERSKAILMT